MWKKNIRFHKAMGVDCCIVMDHCSKDGTIEIIKKLQCEGLVQELIEEKSEKYEQSKFVHRMINLAIKKYHADYVIPIDADEFWWTPLRNLKKAIGNYPHNNIIYVPLKNMVPEEGLTWIEWSNVVLNSIENYEVEGLSKYSLYRSPIPKVIHRTQFYQIISLGYHQEQMLLSHFLVN